MQIRQIQSNMQTHLSILVQKPIYHGKQTTQIFQLEFAFQVSTQISHQTAYFVGVARTIPTQTAPK
jgi:hypothetical protein